MDHLLPRSANGLLGYALIHGHWGLPKLELLGAGVATTTVNFGMCAAALWRVYLCPAAVQEISCPRAVLKIDWPLMKKLVVIGAPIAVSFLLEYGLFSAAGLLMGLISTTPRSAPDRAADRGDPVHGAVRHRHGCHRARRQAFGRGELSAVRRAGFVAIVLGIVFMTVMTLAVIVVRFDLALLFFGDGPQSFAAASLAATLMLIGATFFVADGIQTVAAGALRGLSDTRIPLLLAAISYWAIGFTAACAFAFWLNFGAVGVWIGLSIGTGLYAILLVLRFRSLTYRLRAIA